MSGEWTKVQKADSSKLQDILGALESLGDALSAVVAAKEEELKMLEATSSELEEADG